MPDSTPPADDQAAAAHEFAINIAQGMTNPRQVLCPDGVEGHPWFLVDSAESIACPWCEVDRLRGGEAWTHGFPDPERDATREALDHRDAARIRASVLSGLLRGMARRVGKVRFERRADLVAAVDGAVAAMNDALAQVAAVRALADEWERQLTATRNLRLSWLAPDVWWHPTDQLFMHADIPVNRLGGETAPDGSVLLAPPYDVAASPAAVAALRVALDGPTEAVLVPPKDSQSLDGPTEAAEPRLRPCKLAASSCADPGCTVCYVPPATRAEAAEPTAFTAAARAVLAEWSRMHPSGYLAMYPAMDTLRTALAGSVPVAPALIGTWADPGFVAHQDHRHPVDGCGYCPEEG